MSGTVSWWKLLAWLPVFLVAGVGNLPARAEAPTPRELLSRMQQSYNQVLSYRCEIAVFARKGDRAQETVLELASKKPGMMRIHVLRGASRGREVVIRRDGKIRGRQGGLLKALRVTLDRDDRRLRDLRGAPIWDVEWGALLQKLAAELEQPAVESAVHAGEEGTWVVDLRFEGAGGPERHLYTVDDSSYLLREVETYEGDLLVNRVSYTKERLNLELPNGYFNM